jgi:hypothetical protein
MELCLLGPIFRGTFINQLLSLLEDLTPNSDPATMKFLAIGALLLSTVGAIATEHIIHGAQIIPAMDKAGLKKIGAHGHHKHPDRRTVTIRSSRSDTDDISDDFLWGIKAANHGGRLLLKKGKKYVIGKKLDLSFLDNIEVQLEGELKVGDLITWRVSLSDMNSSPMISTTGKQTISTILSKSLSPSGSGVARISKSLARVL